MDHQMSGGFHATGHYEVDGNRLTLFNDPNCSRVRGTDLASDVWTRIPVCRREVQHLWPGILDC